ncbi:MAG: hypothetical protein WCS32_05715 [Candidatus Izemoplasmatales bacterium]
MKKEFKSYIFYMGIAVFVIGVLLKLVLPENEGIQDTLLGVLSGFGGGIIGVGVVNILLKKLLEKNPEKAKQYEINEKDERNITLREKSGYATWYSTLFILSAVSMTFVILDYMVAGFVAIGAMFLHIISFFIYLSVYNRKI